MKKIARIVVPITISLFLILTGFGGGAALASEGIADLLPYGEQSVPEASGQAEINLSEDGLSGQMELEVSGLTGETTYYVGILDQDSVFSAIGSFTTDVDGEGEFETTLDNGVSRVGVATAPTGADADYVLSTYDPVTGEDHITWEADDDTDENAEMKITKTQEKATEKIRRTEEKAAEKRNRVEEKLARKIEWADGDAAKIAKAEQNAERKITKTQEKAAEKIRKARHNQALF